MCICWQVWHAQHDRALLTGILKHGYGCWGLCLRDAGLGLLTPLQLELQLLLPQATLEDLRRMSPLAVRGLGEGDAASAPQLGEKQEGQAPFWAG